MTGEVEEVIADEIEKEQDEFETEFNKAAEAREGGGQPDDLPDDDLDPPPDDADASADAVAATDDGDKKPVVDEFEGWSDDQKQKYNDLQAKHDVLDHRIKSDDGRVGAFQRKINNLEHDIAEIQKKPGQPSTEDIKAAMGDDEAWKALEEDYPEIAGAINKRFDAQQEHLDNQLAPVVKKQESDAADAAETVQQENYDVVAKDYPTWQTAVQQQDFQDWMASQSPGVQALADSDDTRDASLLIGKYDEHRVANNLPTLKADPEPDGGSVDDTADEVTQRRERQLEDGVTIESKKARIDPNAESEGEFVDAFNAFAKRKEAANNRA